MVGMSFGLLSTSCRPEIFRIVAVDLRGVLGIIACRVDQTHQFMNEFGAVLVECLDLIIGGVRS